MLAETVDQLMTHKVFTVSPSDSLTVVYDLMNSKQIRHVPVVNHQRELVGLVTHRDLVRSALFVSKELPYSSELELLRATQVDSCMVRDLETVSPDTPLVDAARLLLDNKFGCLPVTEGNALVGILTEADFVKMALAELE